MYPITITQTIRQTHTQTTGQCSCCGREVICDCRQTIYGSTDAAEPESLQLPVRREDKRDRYNQRTFAPPSVRRKR